MAPLAIRSSRERSVDPGARLTAPDQPDPARLTKDIDLDCEDSVSVQSMRNHLPKALERAARLSGLADPLIAQTQDGDRSCRWRLDVALPGAVRRMSYEIEISRRRLPHAAYITTKRLRPPAEYRISRITAIQGLINQ